MNSRIALLAFALSGFCPATLSAQTAAEILQKAQQKYQELKSYRSSGKVISVIDTSAIQAGKAPTNLQGWNKPQRVTHEFKIKLGRPSLYHIEWSQPNVSMKGAVWSAGSGDFVLIGESSYSRVNEREMALGTAAGVSAGAAHTVPASFFNSPASLLKTLHSPSLQKEEAIDGEDCHVVAGDVGGQKMVLWISKKTSLIKQKQHILGGSLPDLSKMSDEAVKETLKRLNKEATPEAVAEMKKNMQNAMAMSAKLKGTLTETHQNIVVDQAIEKKEFDHKVPASVKLSASPF